MTEQGRVDLMTVEGTGLRFEAHFNELTLAMDSGSAPTAPSPVQALLAALAACEGMDVISILRKKRQPVSAYAISMSAERAETHPRRLTAVTLVHRVTGHGVSEAAVADAVRLSEEKYCSVHHTLRPDLPITSRIEIIQG